MEHLEDKQTSLAALEQALWLILEDQNLSPADRLRAAELIFQINNRS